MRKPCVPESERQTEAFLLRGLQVCLEEQASQAGKLEVLQNCGMPHLRERVHGVPGVLQAKEILQPVLRQSRQGSGKEREMYGDLMNLLLAAVALAAVALWIHGVAHSDGKCHYDNCGLCPYAGDCPWERKR